MSPLVLLCIFFLSGSVTLRGDDFALCKPLTSKMLVVTAIFHKQMRVHHSLSFLHGLPCIDLCFNRKMLPIPCSKPPFKLAIIRFLAGDVSVNPGPATSRNMRFVTPSDRL